MVEEGGGKRGVKGKDSIRSEKGICKLLTKRYYIIAYKKIVLLTYGINAADLTNVYTY